MANFNPLTNAVGSAGATAHNQYYNISPTNFGEYGFIYLSEIIDNFKATYTGEGKILANVLGGDVSFHAHRALQELSYDTLVSSKSQEIEVCPSLKMPLPHDYVNYIKLVSIDSNGIERIIYPARNTSHPFAISQDDDCNYEINNDGNLQHQEDCTTTTGVACDSSELAGLVTLFQGQPVIDIFNYITNNGVTPSSVTLTDGQTLNNNGSFTNVTGTVYSVVNILDFWNITTNAIDNYCQCSENLGDPQCGQQLTWLPTDFVGLSTMATTYIPAGNIFVGGWGDLQTANVIDPTILSTLPILSGDVETCEMDSNTWSNYSGASGSSIGLSDPLNPSSDNSNYFLNEGQRYGIDPQYAQANGSYFIDHMRGNIHFSSALAGKTIILKYISDGHGTDGEMMIPKMAEEAVYKWIAYGCAQARVDVDQGTIARFKREKAAETRKAKIRLSNIKLEEITQIMRGKSKWIKH